MTEVPIQISYEQRFLVMAESPLLDSGERSVMTPRIIQGKFSEDIANELAKSFSFTVQNAGQFFNQFRAANPLQHGSIIRFYLGDISSGVSTNPPVSNGWIKKFTGNIIKPDILGAAHSRSMDFTAYDKMWSVLNARARISKGTPTQQVLGHLEPFDITNMVWQIIEKNGDTVIDLDESSLPIITRFVKTTGSTYDNPFPAGPMKVLSPNEYDVQYILGSIVFKQPQELLGGQIYGFTVNCHRYNLDVDSYELEDALRDFLD